ncbi:MAG TPA: alginate lyase family protein [Ktedonosporobacter sp.]|nr:alginate lyase family protein [Ktedonosporobacter sp.]
MNDQLPRVFLLDPAVLQKTKEALAHDETLQMALQQLRQQADALLDKRPVSVVEKTQLPASGDKHDYLSLALYYWPDPSKPDGLPYIPRDGEVNPEVNTIPDKPNFVWMTASVRTLALAAYFTDHAPYAAKASELLRVWFFDEETYMKPNLNFAQMIRGLNTGRATGLIDSRHFALVVDALGLLQLSPAWTAQDQQGMQSWFAEYLDWLLNSSFGKEESAMTNNHGTWYDVQASSIALYVGQTDVARRILQESATRRIQSHIQPDGSQPRELRRTRSWHYSVFNLEAYFALANIAERLGIDLWNYQPDGGAGLQAAVDYILPAALKPETWPYQQLDPIRPRSLVDLLYQVSQHYHRPSYRDAAHSILGSDAASYIGNLLY